MENSSLEGRFLTNFSVHIRLISRTDYNPAPSYAPETYNTPYSPPQKYIFDILYIYIRTKYRLTFVALTFLLQPMLLRLTILRHTRHLKSIHYPSLFGSIYDSRT